MKGSIIDWIDCRWNIDEYKTGTICKRFFTNKLQLGLWRKVDGYKSNYLYNDANRAMMMTAWGMISALTSVSPHLWIHDQLGIISSCDPFSNVISFQILTVIECSLSQYSHCMWNHNGFEWKIANAFQYWPIFKYHFNWPVLLLRGLHTVL